MVVEVVEVPSNLGLLPRGVERAPGALRDAGLSQRLGARRVRAVPCPAPDPARDAETGLMNPAGIVAVGARLADTIEKVLDNDAFPVVIGGDCSILLGSMLALRRRGRYGLLHVDGHADFWHPSQEPIGEAASLDLALVTGRGPASIVDPEGLAPLVRDEDVAQLGYRSALNDHYLDEHIRDTAISVHDLSVNEPAGQLAIFFIHALSEGRSRGSVSWPESPAKETFESMLRGESFVDSLARAVLASQAHFFHSLDRAWTVDILLPTFNWDADPSKAKQAWDGFLTWGRLTGRLANDLLPMYESAFPHLASLGQLRERFAEHLSAVAFLAERGPVEDGWLLRFTREAESSDVTNWARFVTDQLEPMTDEIRELAWNRWISSYWRRRIDGNPRPLSAGEAQAIAEWPLELPSNFEHAVDNVCAGPAAGSDRGFYYRLKKSGLPERYPSAVIRLTNHVLSGEAREGFWHCDDALDIARRAAAAGSTPRSEIQTLVDQLLRLHCRGPETILDSAGDTVGN